MSHLTIIITLAGYVALLFFVAWLSSRNTTTHTFFTGGRSTPRLVAAVAMVGAAMSGVTYISVPGSVSADSFSYLQTCLGFAVGYGVISFVLIPLYYRLGVVSLYEYLEHRFGMVAHHTGAWFFFVAKIASASLRAYVICVVLQGLLYDHYDIPFVVNGAIMMALVWLYTQRGGVRSVVWVEMMKSLVMSASIVLALVFVAGELGLGLGEAAEAVVASDYSSIFFMDNPLDRRYFWKQFIAGIFLVVAMTGLDQDMMQTMLSCRNRGDAQRSMMTSIVIQIVVITLFLALGALLYIFVDARGLDAPSGDMLFGFVATECGLPTVVGVLFLLGLVASTYSSAGSALTALTTSFTHDILGVDSRTTEDQGRVERIRKTTHATIAVVMCAIIVLFHRFSHSGAITLIFTMASYTYGPLLGMFAFGILTRRMPRGRLVPIVALASPIVSYVVASHSVAWFGGYEFSYEVILLNAALCFLGLWSISKRGVKDSKLG